jgi:hypothetical protein
MKVRHRRRMQGVPPGCMQQCLPMYQAPVSLASAEPRVSDESSVRLPAHTFANLATELYANFRDLAELRERYTSSHGHKAKCLLERVQAAACEQMSLLERHLDQQDLLASFRRLYVEIRSALVTVQGVCGLAETGLLLREPTGAYWQFGNALLSLWRSCQAIAASMTKHEGLDRSGSVPRVLSA